MIKAAIIGMGKMGLLHGSTLSSFDDVDFIGFSDDNKIMVDTFKKLKPDWIINKNYKDFLYNNDIDVVFITTPISTHYEIIKVCIEKNISFFVEKPAFHSLDQANSLSSILPQFTGKSMVGYMMRFISTFQKTKELINQSLIGDIRYFEGNMYISQLFKEGKGWRYDPKLSGGGVVVHQTCHLLDLINWFLGFPNYIGAITNNWFSPNVEDHAHITLKYNNNLFGWVDSTWSRFNKRMLSTRIYFEGEFGSITVDDDSVKLFLTKNNNEFEKGWTTFSKVELGNGVDIDFGAPYYSVQDRVFINSIMNKDFIRKTDIHDINDSINLQQILTRIYESANNMGKLIKVEVNND